MLSVSFMCAVEISPQFNIKTKQEKQLLYEKLEKEVHPIHRYAAHNRVDLLQALPDGDIDICDNFARNTPLMMATVYHARNAATFLYNKGANPFQKNVAGLSAYDIAVRDNDAELISLFSSYQEPLSPSFYLQHEDKISNDPAYEHLESESEKEISALLSLANQELLSSSAEDQDRMVEDPQAEASVVVQDHTNQNNHVGLLNKHESFMAYIQQHPYFKELSKRAQRKVSSITKEKKTKRVVNPPKKITSKASEQKSHTRATCNKSNTNQVVRKPSTRARVKRTFYDNKG
jgi:hypothetical protein